MFFITYCCLSLPHFSSYKCNISFMFAHILMWVQSCNVTLKLYCQAKVEKSTVNISRLKFCVGSKLGRIFHVWVDASWEKGDRRADSHHLIYSDSHNRQTESCWWPYSAHQEPGGSGQLRGRNSMLYLHHIPEKLNDGYYFLFHK